MKIVKVSLFLLSSIIGSNTYSQNGGNMVSHIIKPGETISSLSRIYHVKKDDIFKLNNLNDRTVLHIGQKSIVPTGKAAPAVAIQTPTVAKVQTPSIDNRSKHLVVAGDNLSRIAKQYHVSEQQLKDWNGLKNDIIKAGNYLVVSNVDSVEKNAKTEIKPAVKETKPTLAEIKPTVVEPIKKAEPTIVTTPTVKPISIEKPIEKTAQQPAISKPSIKPSDFFEKQFVSSQNSVEGLSGTFKTIAGWQDKKYYVLLNNVQSGSVVKVSANNKTVYAKVLGPLPNIKEDNNLALRVSNATAAALGASENKFNVKVEF